MKNPFLANFAATALLGALLAYWSWVWFGPAPAARAPAVFAAGGKAHVADALFGTAPQGTAGSGAVRLMGVVAASAERRGHAVLQLDGKQTVAILQGEDIGPGLRLAEVHADHVVLVRNGTRESLAWPQAGRK